MTYTIRQPVRPGCKVPEIHVVQGKETHGYICPSMADARFLKYILNDAGVQLIAKARLYAVNAE